jgi:hypothetical protein
MAIDGTYSIQIDTPMGAQTAALTLKTDGNILSGSAASGMGESEFTDGTIDGENIAWRMNINSPFGEMTLEFKGNISGDDISGEVTIGNFGTSPFRGSRA